MQFITHTVGRTLGAMGLARTPIDTKGFGSLMSLVEHTAHDSFDLYYGLFMYNPAATEELDRLERAFDGVKKELFKRLHERVRSQLFSAVEGGAGGVGANGGGTPGGANGVAPAR
jgi:arogenate dehydrogenase (NADP+)